ncbi:MAG TPA: PEGA domain-containing protein, partial [Spirochaetia bacterium]|nr:PEGA domain-containing protein [Spirochaetia bacterium]
MKKNKNQLPVVLASILLLLCFFLVGCSSLPPPDKQNTSLFIVISENPAYNQGTSTKWKEVISLEGPTSFNIEVRPFAWKLNFYKLKPGNYRISKRYIQFDDGSIKQQVTRETLVFDVMPKTIHLSPVKIRMFEARAQAVVETVTPDDQRRAVKEVSDYLNFGEWIGSDIRGFGPYRPRFSLEQNTYTYTISTNPEMANVVIDRVDWGTAPVAAELIPGKHLVLVQKEGYADTRTFIDVESDGEITLNLTPLTATEEKKEEKEKTPMDSEHVNLLLVPLQNMGSPESERLAPIFPDIIRTGLSQDKRLTVFDYPEENLSGELTFVPDFSYAEKNGIDLLISGQFLARDEELLVNAALYDVRSEMVKTSLNYTGRVGLSMFNAIDAMTEEFTRNVAKVLPEAGKDVFEETDEIKSQVVAYDKKRTEKDVIKKRLERIFSLSLN